MTAKAEEDEEEQKGQRFNCTMTQQAKGEAGSGREELAALDRRESH